MSRAGSVSVTVWSTVGGMETCLWHNAAQVEGTVAGACAVPTQSHDCQLHLHFPCILQCNAGQRAAHMLQTPRKMPDMLQTP